ncbi:MAG: protoporphyrinogen oxidase [Clostridiales bacterium]|nr:protoporphyrinogen oxidase [Clostridiales bacterium]
MAEKRLLVVGGGLTGLFAAWEASRVPGIQVVLLEKDLRLGGKVQTFAFPDGSHLEMGPDSFLLRNPLFLEALQSLGLTSSLMEPRSLSPFIRFRGRFHRLPQGLSGIAPVDRRYLKSSLLSLRGKAAVTRDFSIPPRKMPPDHDESLFSLAARHFGEEWAERVVSPLYGGIYAGDARELSAAFLQPQWLKDEEDQGSLIRAAKRRMKRGKGPSPFRTLPGGLETLVQRVEEDLRYRKVEIRKGEAVLRLAFHGGKVRLMTGRGDLQGEGVVLALPAPDAAALLEDLDPDLSKLLRKEVWVKSGALLLRVAKADKRAAWEAHPLWQGSGFLVPLGEGAIITGATVFSRKWPGLSSEAFHLRLFVGRRHEEEALELGDEALFRKAWEELQAWAGPLPPPDEVMVSRFARAFPQYRVGHGRWVQAVRLKEKAYPWLVLAGTSYEGVAIPDAVGQGREAGRRGASYLTGRPQPPSTS